MAGEWYHILYNNVYGIRASALRLTNTYGPRMRIKDDRQTFLGVWIKLLLENKPIEVWGGDQLRDFTYVDDAVDALLLTVADQRAAVWPALFLATGGHGSITYCGGDVAGVCRHWQPPALMEHPSIRLGF